MSSPEREQLLDFLPKAVEGEASLPTSLAGRLEEEPELARWWSQRVRQARALEGLKRVSVPGDLDGRVVAAAQGGHRQERVVDHLATLPRRPAPDRLLGAVRHELERPFQQVDFPAPPELDERVAGELAVCPSVEAARKERELDGPQEYAGPRPRSVRPSLAAALVLVASLGVAAGGLLGTGGGVDTNVASFKDVTLFEVSVAGPNSPEADRVLRGLDALAGGAYEGSRR